MQAVIPFKTMCRLKNKVEFVRHTMCTDIANDCLALKVKLLYQGLILRNRLKQILVNTILDNGNLLCINATLNKFAFERVGNNDYLFRRLITTLLLPLEITDEKIILCLLYTSPSPRDLSTSRMPSSA